MAVNIAAGDELTLAVSKKSPTELGPVSRFVLVAITTIREGLALVDKLLNTVGLNRYLVSGLVRSTGGEVKGASVLVGQT